MIDKEKAKLNMKVQWAKFIGETSDFSSEDDGMT